MKYFYVLCIIIALFVLCVTAYPGPAGGGNGSPLKPGSLQLDGAEAQRVKREAVASDIEKKSKMSRRNAKNDFTLAEFGELLQAAQIHTAHQLKEELRPIPVLKRR